MFYKTDHYIIEVYNKDCKKWVAVSGNRNKEWAIKLAQKPYYTRNGRTRVRFIRSEIVWDSENVENTESHSQTEET